VALTFGALACAEEGAIDPDPIDPMGPPAVSIDTARRTTSPELARRNLDASIEGVRAHYERIGTSATRSRLLGLLQLRASMTGAYDDFQAMDDLSREGVERSPDSVQAQRDRASFLLSVHRFDEARAALDAAEAAGASEAALADDRLVIELAVGTDPFALLPQAQARVDARDDTNRWTLLAGVRAATGDFEGADLAFRTALERYGDVSPFTFASNAFRRGVMWAEMADRPDLGRPLYEEAVRRFPDFVVANVHLAELEALGGDEDRALARLDRLVSLGVGDPEPAGYLGELLGPDDAGAALVADANARYDVLLERHRGAFADHGSEFFAGPGGDPARALELAAFNLEHRADPRAYVVGLGAADAAGDRAQRCAWALEAEPLGERHPVLAGEVAAALADCD
jgi:tetratricopeptide (TPR) repeat protein